MFGRLVAATWLAVAAKKCLANTGEEGKKAASSYNSPISCCAAEGVLFTDAMG